MSTSNVPVRTDADPVPPLARPRLTGVILSLVGLVCLVLMFLLMLETMAVYKDPGHVTHCLVNSVFACGRVIDSWQAAVFGFPNAMVGLIIFTATLLAGLYLLAGAGSRGTKAWPHWIVWVLLTAMVGMSSWMMLQQFFVIGGLCTYCSGAWVLTFPAWFYFTLYLLNRGGRGTGAAAALARWHLVPVVLWYIVWGGVFLFAFRDVLL